MPFGGGGILRCVEWYSSTDISGQQIGTIFKVQAVQEEFLQKNLLWSNNSRINLSGLLDHWIWNRNVSSNIGKEQQFYS